MKNIYENLIQEMIVDGIFDTIPEAKELIQNTPIEKRKSVVLDILKENNAEHKLWYDRIHQTISIDDYSEMNRIKDVVAIIGDYIKVAKTEVKTKGEVMTPISLVEEMMDTLPSEVWSNPNLKWLDPCNGVGTFFSVVIERLMKGLESFEPNKKLRYKHIVENMIYVCELQAKNLFLYLYAVDPKDEYDLNVYCGSYLDEGFDNHMKFCGVDKFNVIIMNPPYQTIKNGSIKSKPLWDKFVIKTISQLFEGGFLVAVHPDGWRGADGLLNPRLGFCKVKELLKSKQILSLELHNEADGKKTFRAGTTYDFYCLHNVPNTMPTKIKFTDGTTQRINISKLNFIPNGMLDEFNKLLAKDGEEKVKMIYDNNYNHNRPYIQKNKNEEFKFPVVYFTYKDGSVKFMYSNTQEKGHFNISKVIFSNGCTSTPIIDENGNYAITEFSYAVIDEPKNLPFIQKAMKNTDFLKLMSFSDGGNHRYNYKVISLFRKDFWKEFL